MLDIDQECAGYILDPHFESGTQKREFSEILLLKFNYMVVLLSVRQSVDRLYLLFFSWSTAYKKMLKMHRGDGFSFKRTLAGN